MAMYVKTEYDGFVAKVLITSDTVGEIDLLSKEFRIEIADQLKAFSYAGSLLQDIGALNDPDVDDDEKKRANESINETLTDMSYPIRKITKDNYQDYCNSDDESLWQNGMQFWVSSDRKSMSMRFVPKNTDDITLDKHHKFGKPSSWCSLIVIVGFDNQNVTKFDICLMPRLITGPIELVNETDEDPVIAEASARPDYPFNGPEDVDYLYLNNADGFQTSSCSATPLYVVRSSAFISQDVASANGDELFNWKRFKSDLFNGNAQTGIPIPYEINGESAISGLPVPDPMEVEILPGHSLSGVYMYEINQYIEVSAMDNQDPITFAKNKVRLSIGI